MLDPKNLTPDHEQHEIFQAPRRMGRPGLKRCQYDYRDFDGELFSCVAVSLEAAREKRNVWLTGRNAKIA
jgi:hypothetical protein